MKLKEIDRTANVTWSPSQSSAIYLAAGTAAQQLDSSFSSNATLELYFYDIDQSGLDMPLKASISCESRFHRIIWGSHGMGGSESGDHASGVIVAGCDGGVMQVYDAVKILNNEDEPLVLSKNKHTGPVRALDFNSFRPNIIASGASDSEIYIWDLISPKTAMTTGTKSQPPDDVTHLAWNKQVEHILASTFSNRCVMWDLRKNEPIIKVADTASRTRYKAVEWHPTVATQMCLASEDDTSPVIQLWDLRYATSPLKVLQGHQRGVLALSWCHQDPDLLLSCGKDSNILCWNPNYPHPGYELIGEIPTSSQWSFDVAFCPRNPLIVASCSFEGRISIFGLSGGAQQPVTSSKLADSFPGMDMTTGHTPMPAQKPVAFQLRDAPKWLKRPCGASFAFGGKLIKFENVKNPQGQGSPDQRILTISQVVTLPNLLDRSQKLETSLASGNLADFCDEKASQATNDNEAYIWRYLRASFSTNPTYEYLDLLGFNPNEIHSRLNLLVGDKADGIDKEVDALTDGFVSLAQGDSFGNQINNSVDHGVEDGLKSGRLSSPDGGVIRIHTDDNSEGHLNQALLSGNIEYAVELCVREDQWPEAFILASCAGPALTKKVQDKYLNKCKSETAEMIRIVVSQDWKRLVELCDLENWQQALATILTYVTNENDFSYLAGTLGQRLEASGDEDLQKSAMICYICSGNMDRLADSWTKLKDAGASTSPDALQDLVEQVTILRKAAEVRGRGGAVSSGPLASKMVEYATLLASQGSLELALKYLADSTDPSMVNLRERIQYALGYQYQKPRGIVARSRQSSESGSIHRGSISQKRPSYPSAVSQPLFQPSANTANGYLGSQPAFNPPAPVPPPVAPPVPPPPSNNLPLPPVSSAAHGWNDPPPLIKSLPKPKPVEKVEPTQTFFTPAPVSAPQPFPGAGPPRMGSTAPPTVPMFPSSASQPSPPQNPPSTLGSRPPISSSGAHSAAAPQLYNPAAVSAQPSGLSPLSSGGAPPPLGGYSAGPPPPSGGYSTGPPPPPTSSGYNIGPPPPSSTFTPGLPPSGGSAYGQTQPGLPPSGGSSYGQQSQPAGFPPAPPPSSGYTPGPPPTTGFTPGPPPKAGFTHGGSSGPTSVLAPGSRLTGLYAASSYNAVPAAGGNYGAAPASGFTTGPSPYGGLGQTSNTPSMGGQPGGPPKSIGFPSGPPPPSGGPGLPPGPPPPSGFPSGPPPASAFTPGPPPTSAFAPGSPTSAFPPPPTAGTFTPGPPPTSAFASAPPQANAFGARPPSSSGFPPGPPPATGSPASGPPPASGFSPLGSAHGPGAPPLGGAPPAGTPLSAFPPPPSSAAAHPPRALSPAIPTGPTPSMPPPPPTSSAMPPVGARLSRPPSATGLGRNLTPRPPSNQGSDSGLQSTWESQPLAPPTSFGVPSQPPQTFSPPPPAKGTFSPPPPAMNPTSPSPSLPPPNGGAPPKSAEPAREAVEQPKGSIPDEHKELLEVLEQLRSQCYSVAALPQIKRKLEDVARKLEIMREKLREGSLSTNTLNSLHNIVNALKNRDYQLALSIHTQLVTAGNFAEISSFLPSIKVLIQSAASLNVFL